MVHHLKPPTNSAAAAALSTTIAAQAGNNANHRHGSSQYNNNNYCKMAAAAAMGLAALGGAGALADVTNNNDLSSLSSTKTQCEEAQSQSESAATQSPQQQQVQATSMAMSMLHPAASSSSTSDAPRNVMLKSMRSLRGRPLSAKYNVDWLTVLGEGAYGSVHPARHAKTGEKVALKKISRNYTNASGFKTETDALLRIYDNGGHPNISGLRDMYEDHNSYFLILDLVSGGEMFEHLISYGAYSESDAARVRMHSKQCRYLSSLGTYARVSVTYTHSLFVFLFAQLMYEVASALAFLHGVGVIHADLKPEV